MSRFCVISNPNSRQNKANPKLAKALGAMVKGRGDLIETQSLEALEEAATGIAQADYDIIAMNGGDGTNHCSLSALIRAYGDKPLPKILFLKGGTMNTVPTSLGLRGSPRSLLKEAIKRDKKGKDLPTRSIDTMKVEENYGFLFGTGMMANFLEVYYEGGDASPWKAVKVLTSGVASAAVGGPLIQRIAKKADLVLTVDGESWPLRGYDIVGAGTVQSVAWSFRPFYKALDVPGTFHLWGVSSGPWELAKRLPQILRATSPNHEEIREALIKHLVLESSDGSPVQYQVDGDLYLAKSPKLSVEIGPAVDIVLF